MTTMSAYMKRIRAKLGHDLLIAPSVTVLAFDDARRLLLVRHAEGNVWVPPGGMIEPRERPADAAVREMREETGCEVELVRICGVYAGPEFDITYANGDQSTYVTVVFEARVVRGDPRPDGKETLEVRYYAKSELPGVRVAPWVLPVLTTALAERSGAYFAPPTDRGPLSRP